MNETSAAPLWGVFLLLLLIWLTGAFYGFTAAVRNISEAELDRKALAGDRKAVLLKKMLEKPYLYINAIPLLVLTEGICLGRLFFPPLSRLFGAFLPAVLSDVLAGAVVVILPASLGILAFRRIGTYRAERTAFRYLRIVYWASVILTPLTMLITGISRAAARIFGVSFIEKQDTVTEEEIISIVDEAHEQGVIQQNEAEMIQNIISFNETAASDIMTHRKDIVAFDEEVLLKEMVDDMLEEGNSRYPVFRGSMDNIVGVVHYKDALKFLTQNSWARFKPLKEIPGLIRNAVFIPETRGIGDLFHMMQEKKVHMAIVVDEYGQIAGIVTLEDILEEIVGEILDEYDEEEAKFRIQKDSSIMIDALTSLDEVEEELGIRFEETGFETLNGVITARLGHIPTVRDLDREFEMYGYCFRIVSLGNKTVGKILARKTAGENRPQGGAE